MAKQRCWRCGKPFYVPDDEVGDHGCANRLCRYYDMLGDDEDEEDDE